ncbi:hydroxyethylthiazole kinase [Alkalihalobacterium alkalinitrilicum]|uniref:hydroxyethylthiazole kinase n=1 Tax=Alkalihalobacterium alkalinitrilicum TaxID=427920 RepID=UPI000995AF64|nr:hydroxyethylthiazole kinase [Alkalihalobacterium alkalinitrilicum]
MNTFEKIKIEQPLIHCMTNVVVTNFTANGLLAIGASPVMAYAKEEVADLAKIAGALLLNIGTLNQEQVEAMIMAGKAANEAGVPVILDPVGAGATSYRTETTMRILNEVNVTVLRGNGGEIAALLGESGIIKGVDGSTSLPKDMLAKKASRLFQTITVITGEVDVVTDGSQTYEISNGHFWMTKVVGTGCLLGAVLGAFLAMKPDEPIEALAEGLAFYGIAGEIAYEYSQKQGIATYQESFLNVLHQMTVEQYEQYKKLAIIE